MESSRRIDRTFWILAIADLINEQPANRHPHLLRIAARRISNTFAVSKKDRVAAVQSLHANVIPLT